jgi:hypothetical protein
MSKEERKRRRQERREQEVVDALETLRFFESQGIEPVVTRQVCAGRQRRRRPRRGTAAGQAASRFPQRPVPDA